MVDPITGIALGTLASQVVAKLAEKALDKTTDAAVEAAPGAVPVRGHPAVPGVGGGPG